MAVQTDARSIKDYIEKAKRYYRYFVITLAAATAVIIAIYFLAPRPENGYVSSHPLAIATTYVIAGLCWAFVIAVVYWAAKSIAQWGAGALRRPDE